MQPSGEAAFRAGRQALHTACAEARGGRGSGGGGGGVRRRPVARVLARLLGHRIVEQRLEPLRQDRLGDCMGGTGNIDR